MADFTCYVGKEYKAFDGGETLLAVSAPDDTAAGQSCGERCASLNRVMEELAVWKTSLLR